MTVVGERSLLHAKRADRVHVADQCVTAIIMGIKCCSKDMTKDGNAKWFTTTYSLSLSLSNKMKEREGGERG